MAFSTIVRVVSVALLAGALLQPVTLFAASKADKYFNEAREYLAKGERRAAIIQLKNALQAEPSHVQSRLVLGSLYLETGDGPAAAKEFGRAGRLGADKKFWLLGYARALAMQRDFRAILDEITTDEEMSDEQVATVLAIRGNAYVGLQRPAEAKTSYDDALQRDPSNPLARLGKAQLLISEGRSEDALLEFDRVLADFPDHVQTRLARAELQRAAKRFDRALQDYEWVIAKDPGQVRGYVGRALVLLAFGRAQEALSDVGKVKKLAKGLPIGHYLAALATYQLRDFDTASEELQQVLRLVPSNVQAQMLFGIVSYARGDYAIADDYLSRTAASFDDNVTLAKLLGATRLKLHQAQRAVDVLEQHLAANPDDPQLLALLGTAYLQLGDNTRGSDLMERAVELAPDQALLLTQLAVGQIASGDTRSAIGHLESAVELGQDLIQADVLLVLSYLKKGEFDKAQEAVTRLEARMPDSPIPANIAGLVEMAQKHFVEADAKFERALEIDPGFTVARMNQARNALLRGDQEAARVHYRGVLQMQDNHLGALLGLAALEQAKGRGQDAENLLQRANQAHPGALRPILLLAEHYLRRNEALKAGNLLAGLDESQSELPAALRLRGMAQLQSGEFSSAVRTLSRLAQVAPDNVEAWFQLARAQAAAGDGEGSRASFSKGIELDQAHAYPILWIGLGELELREKNFDGALDVARRMQTHFPDNAMAYEIEAAAYRRMGRLNEALTAVEKAVRVEGSTKRVNLFAHTLAASGQIGRAIDVLSEWVGTHPDDGVAWSTLGIMNQQAGRVDAALPAYEKALEYGGQNPVVLNNMAWLYLEREPVRARELAAQAYQIAPERAEIIDTYGWIEYKQGAARKGLNLMQQALVIAPRNAEIALHVGEALIGVGREAEAKPILERVVRDDRNGVNGKAAQVLLDSLR